MPAKTQQIKFVYSGKPTFGGMNTSVPESDVDTNESPFLSNVILRRGEIRSRCKYSNMFLAPQDGTPVRDLVSFFDLNAVMHTVCITRLGFYQLSQNWPAMTQQGRNPWLTIQKFGQGQPDALYSHAILQANLVFSNGGTNVFAWNGQTNTLQVLDSLADGTSFGAFFMMELAAKIIVAYTIETKSGVTNVFPFRVRWTATGATAINGPNQFDPSVQLGAGFNDEFDVPDIITQIAPLGRTGYIYRSNGISEMIPNQNGTGFDFDHLWASDRGIGNVFSQTLATYGPLHIFVSSDNIYSLTPNSFEAIGTKVFDSISDDLDNANGLVMATILPQFSRAYPYTVYKLIIPQKSQSDPKNSSIQWLYDLKEKNWTRWLVNGKQLTAKPRMVYIN